MNTNPLAHLDDATLRRDLHHLVAQERPLTAKVIEHVGEFDARRLYLAEACSSMFAWCVGVLHFSEDAAYKRIQAARTARRFPRLLDDLSEGRLHLAAVCLIAPHLTATNLDEVVGAATHRSKAEIESYLAKRFAAQSGDTPTLRARVTKAAPARTTPSRVCNRLAPGQVNLPLEPTEGRAESQPPTVEAAPARFVVHIPVSEATREKLRRAQDLLAHAVPSGELSLVFDRALDALLDRLEARKHAIVKRPRPARAASAGSRAIPAAVRRAVWIRDGGRCTFTSASGRRCEATRGLEYDHVVPFARGGESTVEGVRLRCRAHNQYGAEQAFGVGFMQAKRGQARPEPARQGTTRPGAS